MPTPAASAQLRAARRRIAGALAVLDFALTQPLGAAGRDALLDVRLALTNPPERTN